MPSWTPASICRRLERDGHFDLLEAVRQREITAHHAGCIAGYLRRAATKSAPGDDPRSKRRLYTEGKLGR